MSWHDWLLFFHVGSVFVLGIALVGFWAVVVAGVRPAGGDPQALALTIVRPANVLVAVGAIGTLVFGVWLAIDRDEYSIWDGWIITSLVLLIVGIGCGQLSGMAYQQAVEREGAEAATLRRRGLLLHSLASILYLVILVLMIYKPGA